MNYNGLIGESPPNGYVKKAVIDLTPDQRMKFSAILFGLVLIIAVSILMVRYVAILRPGTLHLGIMEDQGGRVNISLNSEALLSCFVALVFVLIFHELLHGVTFWCARGSEVMVEEYARILMHYMQMGVRRWEKNNTTIIARRSN